MAAGFLGSAHVRFGEKQTLHCCFRNAQNNAKYLSVRMTAFRSKADIKLDLGERAANDPKRTSSAILSMLSP